jgi:hypothetical protein
MLRLWYCGLRYLVLSMLCLKYCAQCAVFAATAQAGMDEKIATPVQLVCALFKMQCRTRVC